MNRKLLVPLIGMALVLALGAAYLFWQRPPTATSTTGGTTTGGTTTGGTTTGGTANGTSANGANGAPEVPGGLVRRDNGFGEQVLVQPTSDKAELASLYARPYIVEYYTYKKMLNGKEVAWTALPAFDYNQPLTGKTYLELALLRNTLYARNGYCFMNATLRRYFDETTWYKPVWNKELEEDGKPTVAAAIPVPLTGQEMAFEQKIIALETKLLAGRVAPQGGYPMIGVDFVTNQREFQLAPALRTGLALHNFAMVPTKEEQLFYLYDKGEYSFTPALVTTDLFIQLLHKYLNGILSDVEEKRLLPVVSQLLGQGNGQARALAAQCQQPAARNAAEWAAAYYAVGQHLLTGRSGAVPPTYTALVAEEVARATKAEGKGSNLLQDSLFEYSALKPRGMYTRNDTTKRYFRTVKWLNTGPVFIDTDAGLLRALALAKALAASPAATRGFQNFTQVLDVLVGNEDNRSLTNLLKLLASPTYAGKTLDELAAPALLATLRPALLATGTDRIRAKGITAKAQVALARPTLLFTAARYTFDGEILSRLTEVRIPQRPAPKGLDVFATFGNAPAQAVLLNHYHEAAQWPAYPSTLRQLQQEFAQPAWNLNLYNKTLQTLLSLNKPTPVAAGTPLFARTPAWQKRNLSTALGGWAELKHDLLLYSERPMAAEMGDGGDEGPPAPIILAYVEPNLPFWDAALALLAFQDQALNRLHANTAHLTGLNKEMREKITGLRAIAQQELRHEQVSPADMADLAQIGGWAEQLTFNILKTDHLSDREQHMGVVADVYAYNKDDSSLLLEEAVGTADALYTVVEINGTTVVAVGPVFSYYEFGSGTPLTDEEWQAKLVAAPPARPTWLRDIIAPVPKLNTNGREGSEMQDRL